MNSDDLLNYELEAGGDPALMNEDDLLLSDDGKLVANVLKFHHNFNVSQTFEQKITNNRGIFSCSFVA